MSIGHTGVMPSGWGSSKKRKGAKIKKTDNEIYRLACNRGFEGSGMNLHQVAKAKAYLEQLNK